MTARPNLFPIEPLGAPAKAGSPTVFVRTFTTPSGLPWDQSRVAELEARSGAPLPLTEVLYQVRRLDPWLTRREARYAAFYIRSSEDKGPIESTVEVQGRRLRVRFTSSIERGHSAKRLAVLAAGAAIMGLVASAAITSVLNTRGETSDRLTALTPIATAKLRAARTLERQRLTTTALDGEGVRHLTVNDVLADLSWASNAAAPAARIEAFHWDQGQIAVEVRGEDAPFQGGGRTAVKAARPLRPQVWLWGVEPLGSRASPP